jgi:hypothetical protein
MVIFPGTASAVGPRYVVSGSRKQLSLTHVGLVDYARPVVQSPLDQYTPVGTSQVPTVPLGQPAGPPAPMRPSEGIPAAADRWATGAILSGVVAHSAARQSATTAGLPVTGGGQGPQTYTWSVPAEADPLLNRSTLPYMSSTSDAAIADPP